MFRPAIAVAATLLVSLAILGLLTDSAESQAALTASSASVDGDTLTITLSSQVDASSAVDASDFTVSAGGSTLTIDSASVAGTTLTLTLDAAVRDPDCDSSVVTVSYSQSGSSIISSGTELADFTDLSVTNLTDDPPAIASLETDLTGGNILVTFCEAIADISYRWSNFSAFTVLADGDERTVSDLITPSSSVGRLEIRLGTSDAIEEGETVTVAYDQSQGDASYPLEDLDQGNRPVESWSAQSVTNSVDRPPTLTSVSALYDIVTLTFSEALDEDSVPGQAAFLIGGVQHVPGVAGVSISGATVTLTMDNVLHNRNSPTYTLRYTKPDQSPLRQTDGAHDVASISSFLFNSTTPTAKPVVSAATVDGSTLQITFDLPLKAVAPAGAFTVNGQPGVTVNTTSFSGSVVTLVLSPAVTAGSTITVSYTKPGSPPRVEGRNAVDADSFTDQTVTNNTVAPIPEFSSAEVSADGATLTITFSLDLDESAANLPAGSTVSLSGTSASIASLTIAGSSVSLSLHPPADVDETITVGYTPPSDQMAGRLQSADGSHAVGPFSNQPVTNNADGRPRTVSAEVDGAGLTITFDRPLDAASLPAASSFALAGTTATVADRSIDGSDLTLTLDQAVNHTETVTVSYSTPSGSPLKRDGKEILVESFTALAVTNITSNPTPTFHSASIDASGRSLTIVMSHPLLSTIAGIPAISSFTLTGSAQAAIESVAIDGSNVRLGLNPAADVNETITISYQPPSDASQPSLQSADGVWRTPAWSNQAVTNDTDGKPRPVSATVFNDSLALQFDRSLDESQSPPTADFDVTPSGVSVTGVSIDGTEVTLSLSQAVEHDDAVTLSYLAADSVKLKRDGQSLFVETFSDFPVTNNTQEPLVRSVVGDGATIVISFSVMLDTGSTPVTSAFSLGSNEPSVSHVLISSMAVTLTLSASLVEDAEYTLTYTAPPTSPLLQSDLTAIPGFMEPVTNDTDLPPEVDSVVGNEATLTITFDQPLDSMAVIAFSLFSLSGDSERTVSGVSIDDSSLSLTISSALKEDESALVIYTKPSQNGIVDSTGHQAESFTAVIDNRTDTAPAPVSATVEEDAIVIILDQDLYEDPRFDPLPDDSVVHDHFTFTGTDADVLEVRISNEGPDGVGKIEIKLSEAVKQEDTILITYYPSTGNIPIRDDDAGQNRLQINGYELTNLTMSPPAFESATLNDSVLTVEFDRALDSGSMAQISWFTLTPNTLTIESATIDGSTLELGVAPSATEDDDFRLTYSAPLAGGLVGETGQAVTGLSEAVEVDNVTDYAPYPVSIMTDESGAYVYLRFDQRIDPFGTIDHSWFTLIPPIGINRVDLDANVPGDLQLRVTLEEPVREGATVTLTYATPLSGGLRDDDAGNLVVSFSERLVTNNVDVAPLVTSATVNGRVLTMEFDQPLHDDPDDFPPASCEALQQQDSLVDCANLGDLTWFTVQRNNNSSVPIVSVSVVGSMVRLNLAERIGMTDVVEVQYQSKSYDGSSRNLRDRSDPAHQVEGFMIPGTDYEGLTIENVTPAHPTAVAFDRETPAEMTIEFDGPLPDAGLSLGPWLSVLAGQSSLNIAQIQVQGSALLIQLSTPIPECVEVRVAYSSEDGGWLDVASRPIESFVLEAQNLIDSTWGLKCIEAEYGRLILTFASDEDRIGPAHQWKITVNEEDHEVTATQDGAVVTLSPRSAVSAGDTVQISHTDTSLSGPGRTVGPFTWPITDPPELLLAYASEDMIVLTFDQPLLQRKIAASRFIPTGQGLEIEVSSVEIGGSSVYLRLPNSLPDQPDMFGLVYLAREQGGLAGANGARVPDSGFLVHNYTETPPSVGAVEVDAQEALVTFDQPINGATASPNDFELWAGRRRIDVAALEWSDSAVVVTLAEPVTSLDSVLLSYTPGDEGPVRDSSGLALAEVAFWAENRTKAAETDERIVEEAKLRASHGGTTFERELVRGFASSDGIRFTVLPGLGWTSVAYRKLRLSVAAGDLGSEAPTIRFSDVEDVSRVLQHIDGIPAACSAANEPAGSEAWWLGESDRHGVPTDHGVRLSLSGLVNDRHQGPVCVLDLLTADWRLQPPGGPFVSPSLIVSRQASPIVSRDWLPLAR